MSLFFILIFFSHIKPEMLMHQHVLLWQQKIFLFAEVNLDENKS